MTRTERRKNKKRKNKFFLVLAKKKSTKGQKIFVTVTEDFIELRVMAKEIVGDKFEIGDYKFQKAAYKVER